MTTRETAPTGAPCWVDLTTSDAARSRDFYSRLFGWRAEEPVEEYGGYSNFTKDGVLVAGCLPGQPGFPVSDVWSVYLASDDAAKTVEAAGEHGGRVHSGAMPVGELGTMAVLADTSGAMVGVWQPGTHQGFGVLGEPGTPSWFELHTRDYARVVSFYREVFGWDTHTVSDTDEFRYTVMKHGDDWLAGVMDAANFGPDLPPLQWAVYFGAEDTDAALELTTELGGSVIRPAEDTPYGRIAEAADPTGARFKLVAANEAMPG